MVCTSLACFAGAVAAQQSARPDPANPSAGSQKPVYESAFSSYRPWTEPEFARWRDANEEMGRLNGHLGHVPGSRPSRDGTTPPPKVPAHAERGGRK
jgi:hypothetical protein